MNTKNFLLKRRYKALFSSILLSVLHAIGSFFRILLTKRTVLFVTNQKIRSITVGPISQLCLLVAFLWVGNLFYQSLQYNEIIDEKSQEISRLNSINEYFETEFINIDEKLKKVNDYLYYITGRSTLASEKKEENKQFNLPDNLKEEDFNKTDKHTLNQVKEVNKRLSNIQDIASVRIEQIEKAIAHTGLNLKKPHEISKEALQPEKIAIVKNKKLAAGGPMIALDSINNDEIALKNFAEDESLETLKFGTEIDRLISLEKLSKTLPLARPMKNYFVSSGFGARTDPLHGGLAIHQGLDFVGPNKEKIISPSSGKIVLAGRFSDYGNAVVIDHGFGVTTRYGHLSVIKVKVGDQVKKGDIIALQGSTGRSTGQHLHYEVRYKNIPLNPKRFLEAGDFLFTDSNHKKHANS